MKNSIGFYGGTFDPIHYGHIQLAISLLELGKLEKVYFCPTALSPFKTKQKPKANKNHRLEMLKLAIGEIKKFDILEEEIHEDEVSYTVDTIKRLKQTIFKEKNLRLILGKDMIASFPTWKNYETLLELSPPLCGLRTCHGFDNPLGLEILQTPVLDISSTDIRERIKSGKYIHHLLPRLVVDYIKNHQLYL